MIPQTLYQQQRERDESMSNTKTSRSAVVFIAILLAVFAFPCFGESEKAGDAIPQDGEGDPADAAFAENRPQAHSRRSGPLHADPSAQFPYGLGEAGERAAEVMAAAGESCRLFAFPLFEKKGGRGIL